MLNLDAETGLELILKAMEQERDERLHRQWTAQLPIMAYAGKNISFAEYKDRVTGASIDRRPVAEIQREIDEALQELGRETGTNGA